MVVEVKKKKKGRRRKNKAGHQQPLKYETLSNIRAGVIARRAHFAISG